MGITRWLAVRRADVCALAGLILFFAAFFGPVLWRGQFLVAGDAYYQTYPLRTVAWDMIRRGEWPLWTPYIFSGYPLLSLAQLGLGYPLTWGYLFLPGYWAEQLVVLAPFLLAPVFTYLCARQLGRTPLAALLAGLAFTYGGALGGKLGGLSPMPNSALWLPLMLLAVERARRGDFTRCLLGATAAYAMSVLAGHAQAFLLVGTVALAYAVFVTLFPTADDANGQMPARRWWMWPRWRPLAVAGGGMLLAAGVAAFQILETMRVVRRSVRSSLDFETFNAGAFTPSAAVRSFAAPLYHYIEVSTYIAPLAALLALFAVAHAIRQRRDRRPIYFWLGTAACASVLMLGDSTPLARVLYYVPVLNLFRYPSRHAFEWTFSLSILAAYGWDALSDTLTRKHTPPAHAETRARLIGWLLFVVGVVIALLWWRDAFTRPLAANFGLDSGLIPSLPEQRYLLWKLAFTTVIVLLVWRALKLAATTRGRGVLLGSAVALACFVEPRIFCAHVWFPYARTPEQFTRVPPVELFLQQYPPAQQRTYTRVNLFVRGYSQPPALDLPNMTAPRGLHNVAGYEQLILARYSRALGDAGPDAVNPRYGVAGAPDETLFADSSHVLDLLNTSFVVTFPHLATSPEAVTLKDGVPFAASELARTLPPGETATLDGEAAAGDTLALVTSLANSADVADGQVVARVRLRAADGTVVERNLRAGTDTAEWAHERADVRATIRHKLAPVFDSAPGDAANSYPAHRYWTRLALGARLQPDRVEIMNVTPHATLSLWKATLYDGEQRQAATLAAPPVSLDPARWRPVFNRDGVVVWRNDRALPRAWLVAEAEGVDGEEAFRRIRGDGTFDPRRTALVEDAPAELPRLPGGALPAGSSARVLRYEPNRILIETDAPTDTLLVVSEIFYPGWVATVDAQPSRIHLTDYLLRGVALPAGQHRVELRYTAPAAGSGAIISVLSLLALLGLAAYSLRRRQGVKT